MSKQRTIILSDIGAVGFAPDAQNSAETVSFLDTVQNAACKNKTVQTASGAYYLNNLFSATYDLFAVKTADGTLHIVCCGASEVYDMYIVGGASPTVNITRQTSGVPVPYTGGVEHIWTGGIFNGVGVFNNGVDVPQQWLPPSESTLLTALNAWPTGTRAKLLRPFKNVLVALDITEGGTRYPWRVRWSSFTDTGTVPETWDVADATSTAGEVDVPAMRGYLKDLVLLGDRAILYSEGSVWAMSYVGGQQLFSFESLFEDFGALNTNCAVEVLGQHFVVTQSDIVLHNGTTKRSLAEGRVKDWFFKYLDPALGRTRCAVFKNEAESEVWICAAQWNLVTVALEPIATNVLIWNYKADTWYIRTNVQLQAGVQAPAHNYAAIHSSLQLNTAEKLIIIVDGTTTNELWACGVPFPKYPNHLNSTTQTAHSVKVERTGLTYLNYDGSPNLTDSKTALELILHLEGDAGAALTVSVGTQDTLTDTPTYTNIGVWTLGTTRRLYIPRLTSAIFALKLESSDSALNWALRTAQIDVVVNGVRR